MLPFALSISKHEFHALMNKTGCSYDMTYIGDSQLLFVFTFIGTQLIKPQVFSSRVWLML